MYYMMHSGEYMPDGKFIATANGLGIPTPSARSMWFTIRHPEHITMSVVWQIFFYERGLSWDHYRIPDDPYDKVSLATVKEFARDERQRCRDEQDEFWGRQNDNLRYTLHSLRDTATPSSAASEHMEGSSADNASPHGSDAPEPVAE